MRFIGVILADTDRAFYFQDWFWHVPEWMPKSQVQVMREDDTFEIQMEASQWIADQKQLFEFKERTEQDAERANKAQPRGGYAKRK